MTTSIVNVWPTITGSVYWSVEVHLPVGMTEMKGPPVNGRELSPTERYAIAKIALFQAFDERPLPAQMKDEVRVRQADVDAIVETLDL